MAGDVAADVGGGDAGLGAQRRDDRVVDVVLGDGLGADREQHVDALAGLAVQPLRLVGPQRLPGLDGLADDRVDGLGERGAGLVHGNVEQADRVLGEDLAGVAGMGRPSCCQRMQPTRSRAISSLRSPENSQVSVTARISSHRIVGVGGVAGQIGGVQVQPGPQQLGPHLVGDHAGVGADQGGDAARHGQRAVRVEPAADPFPFLAVAEERAGGREDALPWCAGRSGRRRGRRAQSRRWT